MFSSSPEENGPNKIHKQLFWTAQSRDNSAEMFAFAVLSLSPNFAVIASR